ncbi:MAG: lytic transglycosylase domain-containing protein, partial [Firmicutes bacterium]|nr:lytic transglycosylase domain-containing protein [Bacillota bacterium]
ALLAAAVVLVLTAVWTVTVAAPYQAQWSPVARDSAPDYAGIEAAAKAREFIADTNPYLSTSEVDKLVALFLQASREHGVELELLLSVSAAESHFRADVVSSRGCIGIMQIKPSTARALGVNPDYLYQAPINIDTGARYLKQLLDRYGDETLAVAAYNAGPSRVRGRVPAIRETKAYVARVARHREVLRK